MFQKQKETILSLVKRDYETRNFIHHYLLPYRDFFDTEDAFTDFQGERSDGKAQYASLIEQITSKDEHAQVFVVIYGFEEDGDDTWIYADELIIFSELPISEIRQLLTAPNDIFPSEIGERKDITEEYILIDKEGTQYSVSELCGRISNVYYCWWD